MFLFPAKELCFSTPAPLKLKILIHPRDAGLQLASKKSHALINGQSLNVMFNALGKCQRPQRTLG